MWVYNIKDMIRDTIQNRRRAEARKQRELNKEIRRLAAMDGHLYSPEPPTPPPPKRGRPKKAESQKERLKAIRMAVMQEGEQDGNESEEDPFMDRW